jgi:DNA-directed RNA polymerase specialized sigma24 family protein
VTKSSRRRGAHGRHGEPLHSHAETILGDDAEDVVDDILTRLQTDGLAPNIGSLGAYLNRAAVNPTNDLIEQARYDQPIPDPDPEHHQLEALGVSVEMTDHPVNALVAQGDTVVATGDVTFRVRENGKAGSSKWVYIWKLANGQVQSYDQWRQRSSSPSQGGP